MAPQDPLKIVLLDDSGAEAAGWLFRDAAPVAYQLSPLHALDREPVVETLELTVGHFEAVGGVPAGRTPRSPDRERHRPR